MSLSASALYSSASHNTTKSAVSATSTSSTTSSSSPIFSISVVIKPEAEKTTGSSASPSIADTVPTTPDPSSSSTEYSPPHSFSTTFFPSTTVGHLPATTLFTTSKPAESIVMTSSAKSSQTSPTFVAPQATNASHSPRTHRAAVIAGATVSAIALLGLIAVALTLLYRRYLRHKSLPTFRFGFHRNHSRRAFIVHSRGANYDDGDDDWKVESTFSPTTDTPGYFDAQLMTKTPHYIVHSESRRGSTVSGSSQVALWAATHLVQPVPLSPLSRPASPPADALQRMKSVTSSVGSEYSTESAVSRNRDPQFLGRLP